jgi:heme-degrading monooxygenase HmoA
MFARIARYTVSPDRLDEATRAFEEASAGLGELRGNSGGYLLVDRETGTTITLTLWENHEAMVSSEVQAASLRRRAIGTVEGDVEAVECFDVALEFAAAQPTA